MKTGGRFDWPSLTKRKEGKVESEHDDPEPEYEEKDAAAPKIMRAMHKTILEQQTKEPPEKVKLADFKLAEKGTVGEIAARGVPPEDPATEDITQKAMADGEAMAQQQAQMAAEQEAAAQQQAAQQPAPKPKKKAKKKDEGKKDDSSKGHVTVNIHNGKSDEKRDDKPEKKAGMMDFFRRKKSAPTPPRKPTVVLSGGPKGFKHEDHHHYHLPSGDTLSVHKSISKDFNDHGETLGDQMDFIKPHLGTKAHLFSPKENLGKKASAPATGAAIGASLGAGAGGLRQYLDSKPRKGGKSREELRRETDLSEHKRTAENEGQGRFGKLKQKYLEAQLRQSQKNKKAPSKAALLAALPSALAGGGVGYATGKAL